ncbi:hypothetical protein JAAARDRAFT_615541 [Jaapia argillacea MUCL 33604]|uniref:Transmembrane protein n=1 Tax=Jaapia argillacea MUCL 33604 TaxID=933084 RepID=A0A067P4P2_9AGAM|nr:hypothetical protein JAAARDRAFT_615541 [Jaapia argillacea MUCL 33604]
MGKLRRTLLGCVILSLVFARLSSSEAVGGVSLSRRQMNQAPTAVLIPGAATTSSFDYWWPFPPGGVYATSTAMPSRLSTSTSITATGSDAGTLGTDTSSRSSANTSTSSTSPDVPPSTTSTGGLSSSSVMTHITALPPSNTPPAHHPSKPINPLYLIPVFAFVGVCTGSALALLCLRWCCGAGGSGPNTPELIPGPMYVPAQDHDNEKDDDENERDVVLEENGKGSWLSRAISKVSARSKPPQTPFSWPPTSPAGNEHDMTTAQDDKYEGDTSEQAPLRSPDPRDIFSPETPSVPYDSMRQKSIRRGLLERIRMGSVKKSRQRTPEMEEGMLSPSYMLIAEDEEVCDRRQRQEGREVESGINENPPQEVGLKTGASNQWQGATEQEEANTIWEAGSGFRIVEEETEEDESWLGSLIDHFPIPTPLTKTSSSTTSDGKEEDKYSPIPSRKFRVTRGLSQQRQVQLETSANPSLAPKTPIKRSLPYLSRVDSSILPASPSLITSPQLSSQLLFGSTSPLTRKAKTKRTNGPLRASTQSPKTSLQNPRGPPIPFPSMSNSSPSSKLVTKAHTIAQVEGKHTPSIVGSPGTTKPADRYRARHTALMKVEDIVTRSWSQRELKGEVGVSSPTMFGAEVEAAIAGAGIEQRLDSDM